MSCRICVNSSPRISLGGASMLVTSYLQALWNSRRLVFERPVSPANMGRSRSSPRRTCFYNPEYLLTALL